MMRKLTAIIMVIVMLCILPFIWLICCTGYSDEEIEQMRAKFATFENNPNFAIEGTGGRVWLLEKKIEAWELTYQGVQINDLFGCADGYFYAATREKISLNNFTVRVLKIDYDTFDMIEIDIFENLAWEIDCTGRVVENKLHLHLYGYDNYYIYDENGEKESRKFINIEEFFEDLPGKYTFEVNSDPKNSTVKIIDNETGEQKTVSWKEDLLKCEEGKYVIECDDKIITNGSSYFEKALERNGICYLWGKIPLDKVAIYWQVVIFTYNFETEELNYYSSTRYSEFDPVYFYIIKR